MLDVKSLTFAYNSDARPWSFTFNVTAGECIAINGPSGSGKSTLLGLLAGFLEPVTGEIHWNKTLLNPLPPWERPITSVFQEYNLFEHLNVETNVGLGIHPGMKLTPQQVHTITDGLERVGLHGLSKRMPAELSGGQRQRVALLRAILRNKPVLLLDEPFTGLDTDTRDTLRAMLLELKASGTAIVLASHDEEDRRVLADNQWSL